MEGFLDVCHRTRDIYVHAISGSSHHRKTVRLRETHHGVMILLAGTEPAGELFYRQELVVRRAGRIVEFLQKAL